MADTLISGIFVTGIYGIRDIWSQNYRDTGILKPSLMGPQYSQLVTHHGLN